MQIRRKKERKEHCLAKEESNRLGVSASIQTVENKIRPICNCACRNRDKKKNKCSTELRVAHVGITSMGQTLAHFPCHSSRWD